MKLIDLDPRISAAGGHFQTVTFLCPRCQRHEIAVDIWNGKHGEHQLPDETAPRRLWHAEQDHFKGWDSLTITPSIDRQLSPPTDPCGGWHGSITNGNVT